MEKRAIGRCSTCACARIETSPSSSDGGDWLLCNDVGWSSFVEAKGMKCHDIDERRFMSSLVLSLSRYMSSSYEVVVVVDADTVECFHCGYRAAACCSKVLLLFVKNTSLCTYDRVPSSDGWTSSCSYVTGIQGAKGAQVGGPSQKVWPLVMAKKWVI